MSFTLSEKQIAEITELLGPDYRGEEDWERKRKVVHELFEGEIPLSDYDPYSYIHDIESACCEYLEDKEEASTNPKQGQINQGLWKLRLSTDGILSDLEKSAPLAGLSELCREVPILDINDLKAKLLDLQFLLSDVKKPPKFRPRGTGKFAEGELASLLYDICERVGKKPKEVNNGLSKKGTLHQLIDILRKSKDLNLESIPGKANAEIKKRNKQESTIERKSDQSVNVPDWAKTK
jgi:hypothetical protein